MRQIKLVPNNNVLTNENVHLICKFFKVFWKNPVYLFEKEQIKLHNHKIYTSISTPHHFLSSFHIICILEFNCTSKLTYTTQIKWYKSIEVRQLNERHP